MPNCAHVQNETRTLRLDGDNMKAITFRRMVDVIPEGRRPTARVEHFDVTPENAKFANMTASWSPGGSVNMIEPGRYARLFVNGTLVMSDTQMEQRTNQEAIQTATGNVLIGGLGLGLIVVPILQKPDVTGVTVIERNADVVTLVEAHIRKYDRRGLLKIEVGDVDTWTPFSTQKPPFNVKRRYDYIYFDIWSGTCADDYDHHVRLHRRYQRYLRKGGKMTSWRHD